MYIFKENNNDNNNGATNHLSVIIVGLLEAR